MGQDSIEEGIDGNVLDDAATEPEATQPETQPISEDLMDMSIYDTLDSQSNLDLPIQSQDDQESPSNFITSRTRHTAPSYEAYNSPSALPPNTYSLDSSDRSGHSPLQIMSSQASSQDPLELTEREAFLFMTYIQKLAPSSDACDNARHFELEVPRLALHQPMIMNGLIALASRYDALCANSSNDIESTFYHNKCIKLLIRAFAQPPETWDSTLLTAVVIARLYEEYDNETDSYYHHLSGTQNLLNHEAIARFVMQGGLAEAASWVHLRQAIYVYVVRREPVEMCLENFERAVYIFAKIMRLFLPMNSPDSDMSKWEVMETEVEEWYDARPVSFKPIFHKPPDLSGDRPFPTIYFAASVPGEDPTLLTGTIC
ncbi:transcription regulatory SNF2 [Fusarium beomiforme]|uniref:Transcription regulatory SNF2 n=1 Tax=Fusarium beomiforme TaxID=44412 RepID=A0A9P5AN86_9HYPO|nr:transcription regulatory SNF2 [Fusarium beomiforme]